MDRNGFFITEYARNLIRHKARKLSRQWLFRPSDAEDIQQELWTAVVQQSRRFDINRAAVDTFVGCIVDSATAMLVRARQRAKRVGDYQALSLDIAPKGSQKARGSSLSAADQLRRLCREDLDENHRRQQAEAIHSALAKMSPPLREVCRQVMRGSISSAARHQGISRRQVRNALRTAGSFLRSDGFFSE